MSDSTPFEDDDRDDDKIVHAAAVRLAASVEKPEPEIEEVVKVELDRWRSGARIQTFVPIFAERTARQRLAS